MRARLILVLVFMMFPVSALGGQAIGVVPFSVVGYQDGVGAVGAPIYRYYSDSIPRIGEPLPEPVAAVTTVSGSACAGGTVLDYERGDWQDGMIVLLETPDGGATLAEILTALPGIEYRAVANIRDGGARRLARIAAPYTAAERETWEQQLVQAQRYLADKARYDADPLACYTEIPMLAMLAAKRYPEADSIGEALTAFVPKVLENNSLFQGAAGAILGHQQGCLDDLEAVNSWAEFSALDCWSDFSLEVQ